MKNCEAMGTRRRFAATPEADMIRQYEASRIHRIRGEILAKEGRLVTRSRADPLFHGAPASMSFVSWAADSRQGVPSLERSDEAPLPQSFATVG